MTLFWQVTSRLLAAIALVFALVFSAVYFVRWFDLENVYLLVLQKSLLPSAIAAVVATGISIRWRVISGFLPAILGTVVGFALAKWLLATIVSVSVLPSESDQIFIGSLFLMIDDITLAVSLLTLYGCLRFACRENLPVEDRVPFVLSSLNSTHLLAIVCLLLPVVVGLTFFSSFWDGAMILFYSAFGATLVILPAVGLTFVARAVLWGLVVTTVLFAYSFAGFDATPIAIDPRITIDAAGDGLFQTAFPFPKHQVCLLSGLLLGGILTTVAAFWKYSAAKQAAFEAMRALASERNLDGQALLSSISETLIRSDPSGWFAAFSTAADETGDDFRLPAPSATGGIDPAAGSIPTP